MYLGTMKEILEKFKSFPDTRVLFSAEQFCWPDSKLATEYPNIDVVNPYLNSGGFIGEYIFLLLLILLVLSLIKIVQHLYTSYYYVTSSISLLLISV